MGGNFVSVGGHQVGKTAKNGLGNAASGVSGSATSGGVDHSHDYYSKSNNTSNPIAARSTPTGTGDYFDATRNYNTSGSSAWAHTHGLSATAAAQTITGDNETRPVNRGVKYIIKV